MFRKAEQNDLETIAEIYDKIIETNPSVGWKKGIYPTIDTAREALGCDELFVYCDDEGVAAAARINKTQVEDYKKAKWEYAAPDDEVMVMHTLVVDPDRRGGGIGKKFLAFYEDYALKNGCKYLRIDTNEKNEFARAMYARHGYHEVGIVPCCFFGLEGVNLVCLEKYLGD